METGMANKPKKQSFDKLGYGAMALYVSLIAVVGLGVYGINVSGLMMEQNRSDLARARVQTGRMLIGTEDRTQCRSIRFSNETVELGHETLTECDRITTGSQSFGMVRDGFTKR